MKDILNAISKHYKHHVIEAKPISDNEAEIMIKITVGGIEPSKLDNIVKLLDIFIQGLSRGKLVIPVTKKTRKQIEEMEEKAKKLQDKRLKAYILAKGLHIEGMENE